MPSSSERERSIGAVEARPRTKEEVRSLVNSLPEKVQKFLSNLIANKQYEVWSEFNGSRKVAAMYLNDYLTELLF